MWRIALTNCCAGQTDQIILTTILAGLLPFAAIYVGSSDDGIDVEMVARATSGSG
jgi:hypothetical protein